MTCVASSAPEKCTVRSSAGPSAAAVAATRSQVLTCPPAPGVHCKIHENSHSQRRIERRAALDSHFAHHCPGCLRVDRPCVARAHSTAGAEGVSGPVGSNLHVPGRDRRHCLLYSCPRHRAPAIRVALYLPRYLKQFDDRPLPHLTVTSRFAGGPAVTAPLMAPRSRNAKVAPPVPNGPRQTAGNGHRLP